MTGRLTVHDRSALAGLLQWAVLTWVAYALWGAPAVRAMVGPDVGQRALWGWHLAICLGCFALGCAWTAFRVSRLAVWLVRSLEWTGVSCLAAAGVVVLDGVGNGASQDVLRPVCAWALILGGACAWAQSRCAVHRDLVVLWTRVGLGASVLGVEKLLGVHHHVAVA